MGTLNKVRKHPDFIHATREIEAAGLDWTLEEPSGKGHPFLRVGNIRIPVGWSPGGRIKSRVVRAGVRRRLREAGLIP